MYQYRHDPSLAFIERPVRPHSGQASEVCRWIWKEGREAVRQAHQDGHRDCKSLRQALLRSVKARFGLDEGAFLDEETVQKIIQTRPDLARDLCCDSQAFVCVQGCSRGGALMWHRYVACPSPCPFPCLTDTTFPDTQEHNKPYAVMEERRGSRDAPWVHHDARMPLPT